MSKNEIKDIDIDNLLKEDNKLQTILIPTVNNPLESQSGGKYIFKNKETFQGKVIQNNRLMKGKYIWPNGQTYYGNLYPDNLFNGKGKIIFPDNSELIGNFDGKNNIIEKAIYNTNSRIYQGSFKNNKLHGKFIIKNKDGYPHYLYIGNYYNGAKNGKFTLEKSYNHEIYKITGNYKEGIKNGEFKIFIKSQDNEQLIHVIIYDGDFPKKEPKKEELIENKEMKLVESRNKINCMKIINEQLLLGSYENLIIYDINNKYEIKFDRKILIFRNEDINDFLETNYKKILLCSNKNNFKLIELTLEEKNDSYLNTTSSANSDFHLIQEFKGLENSKNIFCIVELSNKMIVSGDCENIILWDYFNINNNININNISMTENNNNKKSILDKIFDFFGFGKNDNENVLFISESNSLIPFFEYKIIQNEKLYNIYSIIEIKNINNEIIIGVAEPDSKSINIMKIKNNKKLYKLKKIECHDEIMKKKNIMKCFDDKLFVGCKNKLLVIDINKYEIIYKVFSESITNINIFLNKYIICGVTKKLNNLYDYKGYLLQKDILKNPNSGQMKIINISSFTKFKNKGNIIDICIYNKNSIITSAPDGKILILK
jgi:hypothetical protein